MEPYLPISYLNDFIFCPRSIYFHQLYGRVSTRMYHSQDQVKGLAAHQTVDNQTYTTAKNVLQGIEIYSDKYRLFGKIDTFHQKEQKLIERKKKIKVIYPGYIYQLYAQYFGLVEMGYKVKKIGLHSMDDNKNYPIDLPEQAPDKLANFEAVIEQLFNFNLDKPMTTNIKKCQRCIYNNLCDVSPC